MADGAIDVHIMAPLATKKGLRRLMIPWFGFDWIGICMDGMVGGTQHVPGCTLAYGFTGRFAGISGHVAAMDAKRSGDGSKSVERELSILVQNSEY
jgi:hypothetical protein